MKKGAILGMLFLLYITNGYAQQNIQFSQYIFNSLSVNPAYAGYKEEWFAQVGLRSQWTGWKGAPKTGLLSVDGVLDPVNRRHGVGLQMISDKLGAQTATSIYANYALRLQLDDEDTQRLSLGVAAGVTTYGLDGSMLDPNNPNDPNLPEGMISKWKPDIRLGIYYASASWYAGVSVQDFFAGNDGNEDYVFDNLATESLYRKVNGYFMAGALINLDQGFALRPSLLVKDDFKGPTSLDINAMFIFQDRLWLGGGYRTRSRIFNREYVDKSAAKLSSRNAAVAIAQFYINPRFRIGYSYDIMLNKMSGHQNGSHEVTLGVTFGKSVVKLLNPRYF